MDRKIRISRPNHTRTAFIQLTTRNCQACWKCIENCHKKVIGKVDFFGHSHALIRKPENCTGCLKCVNTCQFGAYKPIV